MQQAIKSFYHGNQTLNNWTAASNDVLGALTSSGLSALLQVTVFSRNGTGSPYGLFNVTGAYATGIQLPGTYSNGTDVFLGDQGLGYPTMCTFDPKLCCLCRTNFKPLVYFELIWKFKFFFRT